MFENFQVVNAPQRSKCNNYSMAAAKEKCKPNILTESILGMDREVSPYTLNRTEQKLGFQWIYHSRCSLKKMKITILKLNALSIY